MKKIPLLCIMVVLLSAVSLRADLVVQDYLGNGQQVVLDTATGYHWYWNLNDFTTRTYAEQIDAISGLGSYGNIAGGWHMATRSEMNTLWSYPASVLGGVFPYTCIDPYGEVIRGRSDDLMTMCHPGYDHASPQVYEWSSGWMVSSLGYLGIYDWQRCVTTGAWVVSTAPVVPIPIPGALALAAMGLLSSTLGLNRLRRKHQE